MVKIANLYFQEKSLTHLMCMYFGSILVKITLIKTKILEFPNIYHVLTFQASHISIRRIDYFDFGF